MCGSSLYVDLAAASRRRPVLYGGVRMPGTVNLASAKLTESAMG
jgi:hypothetical protein